LGLVGLDVKEFGTAIKRALRKPKRSLVLFLGAGCSWPTIPLARDIVDDLRGLYGLRPLRSHEQLYYQHNVEKRMETVDDRYEYFVGLCKDKAPAKPYVELAKLVAKMRADGHTVVIVTTNFDPLFERALGKEMVDTEVCDLGGVRSDLDSLHKMLSHDSESLHVVKLLGSTRGEGKVYFDLENGQEVGRALAKVLPSTARVVVLGYGGAEWGVAEMFKTLFETDAMDPKHLFWCTPPGQGPPHDDPRNVVFRIVKDRHPKWVKDASFASAVVQLGGDAGELEADIAPSAAAASSAVVEADVAADVAAAVRASFAVAGLAFPDERRSPPMRGVKRRRDGGSVEIPVAGAGAPATAIAVVKTAVAKAAAAAPSVVADGAAAIRAAVAEAAAVAAPVVATVGLVTPDDRGSLPDRVTKRRRVVGGHTLPVATPTKAIARQVAGHVNKIKGLSATASQLFSRFQKPSPSRRSPRN